MASLIYAVSVIGTMLSLLGFASPIKTFHRVVKIKSTEDCTGAPYIATFLCTSLWTFYGILKPGGFLVAMVNGSGAIFHCVYIILFLIYSPPDKKVKTTQLLGILDVGFLAVIISVTLFALHGTIQLTFLGISCSGLTIIMYASPLLAMKALIKTKSVEYMPFLVSFFMFLNASVWTLYCFLIKDIFMLVPNLIGMPLGLAQIILYVMYKKKPISSSGSTMTLDLVKAETVNVIEMDAFDNKEARLKDGAMKVVKNALKRVKSLPDQTLNHRNTIGKLLKTLSFEPNNSSSATWTNLLPYHEDDVDIEIGVDIEKYPNPSPLSYNLHNSYHTLPSK